jgi:hypothetical protein
LEAAQELSAALKEASGNDNHQVFELTQRASDRLDRLREALFVLEDIEEVMTRDVMQASEMLASVRKLVAPSPRIEKLSKTLAEAREEYAKLLDVRGRLTEGDLEEYDDEMLRELTHSTNQVVAEESQSLYRAYNDFLTLSQRARAAFAEGRAEEGIELATRSLESPEYSLFQRTPQALILQQEALDARRMIRLHNKLDALLDVHIGQDDLPAAWTVLEQMEQLSLADNLQYQLYRNRLVQATLDKAEQLATTIMNEYETFEGEIVSADGKIEEYPAELLCSKVKRVLVPLLKREPDNVVAQSILDAVRSRLGIDKR